MDGSSLYDLIYSQGTKQESNASQERVPQEHNEMPLTQQSLALSPMRESDGEDGDRFRVEYETPQILPQRKRPRYDFERAEEVRTSMGMTTVATAAAGVRERLISRVADSQLLPWELQERIRKRELKRIQYNASLRAFRATPRQQRRTQRRRIRRHTKLARRARFQTKRYDLTTELDHGGAITHMATLWQQQHHHQQQHQPSSQATTRMDPSSIQHTHDKSRATSVSQAEDDTTAIAKRINDGENYDKATKEDHENDDPTYFDDDDDDSSSSSDQSSTSESSDDAVEDYLQDGRSAPKNHELSFAYTRSFGKRRDRGRRRRRRRRPKREFQSTHPTCLPLTRYDRSYQRYQRKQPTSSYSYFPLSHKTTGLPPSDLIHGRNLVRLAARSIVGCAGVVASSTSLQNDHTNDRLLRFLFSKPTCSNRDQLILNASQEQASNLHVYYCHLRPHIPPRLRSSVLSRMGLCSTSDHHPNGDPLSYSIQSLDIKHRRRTAHNWRLKLLKCAHDGTNATHHHLETLLKHTNMELGINIDASMTTPTTTTTPTSSKSGTVRKKRKHVTFVDADETIQDASSKDDTNDEEEMRSVSLSPTPALVPSNEPAQELPGDTTCKTNIDMPKEDECPPLTPYAPLPGTQPPIPENGQLDESHLLLGPIDKFSDVSHRVLLEPIAYRLTISHLLTQLGTARMLEHPEKCQKVHKRLMNWLELALKKMVPDPDQHLVLKLIFSPPSAPFAMAFEGYCSYVANGGGFPSCDKIKEDNDSGSVSSSASSHDVKEEIDATVQKRASAQELGEHLYSKCESYLSNVRLKAFPEIRLPIGISLIVSQLPGVAGEMVSSSCDVNDPTKRTPFDLVHNALVYLESHHLLVDHEDDVAPESVRVFQLENAFHEAALIFETCIELDSTNIDFHAWHLAALGASLLLCSGNRIGGGPIMHPSNRIQFYDDSSDDSENEEYATCRMKRDRFDDSCTRVGEAIASLLRIGKENDHIQQHWEQYHLILSSVFEWQEMMALLIGSVSPRLLEGKIDRVEERVTQVRRVHAHHTLKWGNVPSSPFISVARVAHLVDQNQATVDDLLNVVASKLESNPGNRLLWAALASLLGPICVQKENLTPHFTCTCEICTRVHPEYEFDHEGLKKRQSDALWWGDTRTSWWDEILLQLPSSVRQIKKDSPQFMNGVCTLVQKDLEEVAPLIKEMILKRGQCALFKGVGANQNIVSELEWLHSTNDVVNSSVDPQVAEGEEIHSKVGTSMPSDERLPAHIATLCSDEMKYSKWARIGMDGIDIPETMSLEVSDTAKGACCESLCYKILVTCHLYSVVHPVVRTGIWFLARGYWQHQQQSPSDTRSNTRNSSDEWHSLVWLASQGLHVHQLIQELYEEEYQAKKEWDRAYKVKIPSTYDFAPLPFFLE